MLTLNQVRWARRHDWFLRLALATEEGFVIEAKDEVVAELEEEKELEKKGYHILVVMNFNRQIKPYLLASRPVVFNNFTALKIWAGY